MNIVNTSQTLSLLKLHSLIFIVFTTLYAVMDFQTHFGSSSTNALYFSASVHTSVGFGDIVPKTNEAKLIVTVHMLVSFAATLLILERI